MGQAQPGVFCLFVLRQGLAMLPRQTSNSGSFWVSLPSTVISDEHHPTTQGMIFCKCTIPTLYTVFPATTALLRSCCRDHAFRKSKIFGPPHKKPADPPAMYSK
jgi:hypothetical protein